MGQYISIAIERNIIKLASPIILVRILYLLLNAIGMVLIARLGFLELAAGALVTVLLNTSMVIAMSPVLAVGIIASRFFGAQDYERIGQLTRLSLLINVLIGSIVIVLFYHIDWLLMRLGEPKELIPLVASYLRVMIWSVVPSLAMSTCHQLCFATRNQQLVVWWSFLTFILTLPLGVGLLFGYFGLPKLGMIGWAYSNVIVNGLMIIGVMAYIIRAKKLKPFKVNGWQANKNWQLFQEMLKIGFPITIQYTGELAVFVLLNLMVGWLGTNSLSIQQITLQCMTLVLMIPMGGAQACAILVGQAIGKQNIDSVKNICLSGLILVMGCMSFIALYYIIFPLHIMALFVNLHNIGDDFVDLAKLNLFIVGLSQMGDAARNILIGCLRGLKDMWAPMWINITLLFLGLPLAYLLGFTLHKGVAGLNLAYLIVFSLGALCMLWRLFFFHHLLSMQKIYHRWQRLWFWFKTS